MEQTQSSTHPGSPIEFLQHSQLGGMAAMTAAAEAHAASLLALFPTASYSAATPQDPAPAVSSPLPARTPSAETAKRLKKHRICQVSTCCSHINSLMKEYLSSAGDAQPGTCVASPDVSVRPDPDVVKGEHSCTRERKRKYLLVHHAMERQPLLL